MADLLVCHLGRVPYEEGLELQERLRTRVQEGELGELLLLLEHEPVYTLGRRSGDDDLPLGEDWCRAQGIDVVRTRRGGKLTYHGPGQLVGYPIMRVGDVPAFVATMEGAIVDALAGAGVTARPRSHEGREYTGVWIGDPPTQRKLASIGIHVSRGVSAHGFAVNVDQRPGPVHLGRGVRAAVGLDDVGRARGLARRGWPASASGWRTASRRRSEGASG